jgi:hypothetical protein
MQGTDVGYLIPKRATGKTFIEETSLTDRQGILAVIKDSKNIIGS